MAFNLFSSSKKKQTGVRRINWLRIIVGLGALSFLIYRTIIHLCTGYVASLSRHTLRLRFAARKCGGRDFEGNGCRENMGGPAGGKPQAGPPDRSFGSRMVPLPSGSGDQDFESRIPKSIRIA